MVLIMWYTKLKFFNLRSNSIFEWNYTLIYSDKKRSYDDTFLNSFIHGKKDTE